TDGTWCLCVADFRFGGGHMPFQAWSLSDGDYALMEATYDGGGWEYKPALPHRLYTLDITPSEDEYLERFPKDQRGTADRAYRDGFTDGVNLCDGDTEVACCTGFEAGQAGQDVEE